jgi:hypothetical protein
MTTTTKTQNYIWHNFEISPRSKVVAVAGFRLSLLLLTEGFFWNRQPAGNSDKTKTNQREFEFFYIVTPMTLNTRQTKFDPN